MAQEPVWSTVDMPGVRVEGCAPVRARLDALDLAPVHGLAFLPANLAEAASAADLRQFSEAPTLRKILRQSDIDVAEVGPRSAYVVNRSAGWVAPILFVSAGLLSENPNAVSIALNVISSYAFELFKGRPQPPAVRLEVIVEQEGDSSCKRVTYEGDAAGLAKLPAVIRSLTSD